MKRSVKIAIPLLLVAVMLITALSVLMFTATAADSNEASFKAATITYGANETADNFGNEIGTVAVGSTLTGSFANMAANLASLAPEVDTRYTLSLNADVTVDTAIAISANEHTEIWIELNGHTITSKVDGPMLTVSGEGATVRINGGFNNDASVGAFVATAANGALVKIAEGSTAYVDVNYLDAQFTGNQAGASFFIAEGGRLTVEHSSVKHLSGSALSAFSMKNANLELKDVTFDGAKSASLVSSSASKIYIEGGEMIGSYIVESDDTASSILITGFGCEVDTAFAQGSADTTTYILGSQMEIYTTIATGAASAENLVFYYGDGDMYIIGQDPASFGVADSDKFSVTESGGTWTMVPNNDSVAMLTAATIGTKPVTSFYSNPRDAIYGEQDGVTVTTAVNSSNVTTAAINMTGVTDTTVRIITMLADFAPGASGVTQATVKGCERVSLIFDINGHNYTYGSSVANSIFTVSHNMRLIIDGADVSGNVGKFSGAGRTQRLVYARQSSNDGQISYHLYCAVKNLNIDATGLWHKSAASSPIFGITCGNFLLENCKITYTGSAIGSSTIATTSCQMIALAHSSYKNGVSLINNVTVNSEYEGDIVMYPLIVDESHRAFITDFKSNNAETAINVKGSGAYVLLNGAKISTNGAVFSGSGNIDVYDADITTASGALSSSISPVLYYGTGKTVINTGENTLSGAYECATGYALSNLGGGVYKLAPLDEGNTHTLSLPAVFSSGMMLQRNEIVNIYGYCQSIGATVEVTIGDKTSSGVVGSDGKWVASFAPMDAAYGVDIKIDQLGKGLEGEADVVISDVNIGEIWVMSGQSNASAYSGWLEDVNELALLSETLNIREFTSAAGAASYTLLPDPIGVGVWNDVNAATVKKTSGAMSALGYATVAKLSAELGPDVPVGLITIAQGSTKISTWVDYEHLKELSPTIAARYDRYVEAGSLPSSAHGTNAVGTVLYNRHVYPLEGFTTAGVLWYQGCGDIPGKIFKETVDGVDISYHYLGPEGSTYSDYFEALEEVFRRAFGNGGTELPFYVMQLAPYSRSGDGPADGSYIYEFKLEQFDFCSKLDNTYLVPIAVDGMAFTSQDIISSAFIHPARKSPVGNRTADMILANEYGIKAADVVSYPMPLSATLNSDGTVTVTFDTELKLFYGDTPDGFELTADGTTWVKATGRLDGKRLILSADGITKAVGVRYGSGRTQVELKDGTVIEVAHAKSQYTLSSDKSYYDIKDALTGQWHTIKVDSTDCIRTKNDGNITNASGIPLVLFSMDVTAE